MERDERIFCAVKIFAIILMAAMLAGCDNPFAPKLNTAVSDSESILGDQRTIEGVYQNFQLAYRDKDTTIYGQLLAPNFIFVYRDYEKGVDVFWGRDEDIRTTHGLFQNVQALHLIWNTTIKSTIDADSLSASFIRNFNLTVTFSADDIVRVAGYASWTLERKHKDDVWHITRWRDESNF